ncbi:Putative GntR-family transcriptional regulator (modular protein) [Nostocoides japonicum T1-X7]|uniref:Putative GntR-family transcriptional regulator (Modular protein) n=1 Tax=Nostocoides japonicum T1-X7 TaxID=1194083 RepID=A0A077M6H9_9MICO|nr:GntR family transcriptional regulator [Tetrasphaera japonica]CCH79769.1 Putative GntR-family transcriptional regulator (modular protein) [Tetrasphaera japonica T1-X7]
MRAQRVEDTPGGRLPAVADPLRPFESRSAGVATTERVLFGRLTTEDPVQAVVRRIRTAIGLGILTDGQKLPKEADLARQLGVTAFSLREALSALRDAGLIVTRVGKNGGSYVQRPPASDSIAEEQLTGLTATELRDLGDWRAVLVTYAAWLAAQRASAASSDRLASYAEELADADTAAAARRALGRFHVELAAAAQSMRLTRAELALHEEFDWLVQVLLRDETHRRAIVRTMLEVSATVRAGDAAAAWVAGEQLTAYLVTELTRSRLRLIAAGSAGPGPKRRRAGDIVAELRRISKQTVGILEDIADDVAAGVTMPPTSGELNGVVARSVLPRLGRVEDLVHGVGFMAEVGLLPEAEYWMEWWQRASDGTFDRDYSHQLDPSLDDFYEYGSQDYLTRPRATGRPNAMGPYIDHGGVDDYLVTVSLPVAREGTFLGVICIDIRVAGLERALSPWLARADGTCLVLNAESRVLLSNAVRYNVGDVLPQSSDLSLTDVGWFGWVVARAPEEP